MKCHSDHVTMKLLLIPVFLLAAYGVTTGQNGDKINPVLPSIFTSETNGEVDILSDILSVSSGFVDSEFSDPIFLASGESPEDIVISTTYLKPLQYTISNVEGIILHRGRFIGEQGLDFSRRIEGAYAVYIFAANRVVRAFIVSKEPIIQSSVF